MLLVVYRVENFYIIGLRLESGICIHLSIVE